MNPSLPRAEAVAVRDDRIVEVGTLDSLRPWLDAHDYQIDDRFAECVLTPGFIDPHLHPSMAAVLLPMHFVTAMEWKLPWGRVTPTTTPAAFDQRLGELDAEIAPNETLYVWGYHQLWHGPMDRARIDSIVANRPVVVWHRSFHELYMNAKALTWLGITESAVGNRQQINLIKGHFYENGLGYAINQLNPHILSPERYTDGLKRLKQVVHAGGHTTIADMATGLFDFDREWQAMKDILDTDDTPFRTELIVHATRLRQGGKTDAEVLALADALVERNTHRLRFDKRIKLFADGAFFSLLAQVGEPGYIDGHQGEWLTPPELLYDMARTYWNAGYRIHLHVTGDLGVELGLDVLQQLQFERPRFDHGFTFEHFGFSTPEQIKRIRALGANVSANVYYLHELSDIYALEGIGYERASQMARLGSCFREGIMTTLHSDFTMAPAEPLNSAWVAVNRINCEGHQMGATECLTSEQALAAITINAAHVIGRADDIGSIRAGKKADFTVLGADPLTCDPLELKDIPVQGTVFEGNVFPFS